MGIWKRRVQVVWFCNVGRVIDQMLPLILLILRLLVVGVVGAIKIAFWVFVIFLIAALLAGFLGRGVFGR